MSDRGDNAPPPADWRPEPRCCPFENCWACADSHDGYGTYPLPEHIQLGEN